MRAGVGLDQATGSLSKGVASGQGLKLLLSLESVPGGPHTPSLPSVCSPLLSAHFYPILVVEVCVCLSKM